MKNRVGFNKIEVIEQILREAPNLSNKRKLVDGKDGKVMVYAYYNNAGTPDPAFDFHRINTPVKTSLGSSLCEIYSVFGYKAERFLRGRRGEGNPHQGPSIDDLTNPAERLRSVFGEINFFRSANRFATHFNNVCKKFKYVPQLLDLHYEVSECFEKGNYGLIIKQERVDLAKVSSLRGSADIIVPLCVNLYKNDPTLKEAMNLIEESYCKALERKSKYEVLI